MPTDVRVWGAICINPFLHPQGTTGAGACRNNFHRDSRCRSSRDAGSAEAPGYNLAPAPDDVLTWAVPDPAPPNSLDLAARLPTGVDRKCRLDQGRGVAASCGVAVSSFNVELQE
jgi:hypothetical protein